MVFGNAYVIKMQDHFQVNSLKKGFLCWLSLRTESSPYPN